MGKQRLTTRVFRSILGASATVLLVSFCVISATLWHYFTSIQDHQLRDELECAVHGVQVSGENYLQDFKPGVYRLTWVDADGSVIYDSEAAPATLKNHFDREEIAEARANGHGSSSRYSSTLTEQTLYEAERLPDGTILRISISRATVVSLAIGAIVPVLAVILSAMLISAFVAHRISRRIIEPLNSIDLDQPLLNDTYVELTPTLERIDAQHNELKTQLATVRRRSDEFTLITCNIREGLILLDENYRVLSINPAAQRLFNTDTTCVGTNLRTIHHGHALWDGIERGKKIGFSSLRLPIGDREFQFDCSRIDSDGQPVGMVILAFDVTVQATHEKIRREFTANVSHELKTPLQGIIGSAELIESGFVDGEDLPRFVGHIRHESSRLVDLIDDVIQLSHLDEGVDAPKEPVSLLAVCREVVDTLQPSAQAKNIRFALEGNDGMILAIRRLIYEIVFNLADNALKYSHPSSTVTIGVTTTDQTVELNVRDEGIGIAPEEQERIFERFYRVDKSHSKESGGTGLGLSIVKHAVNYHNAQIALDSDLGQGTTVAVTFERAQLP